MTKLGLLLAVLAVTTSAAPPQVLKYEPREAAEPWDVILQIDDAQWEQFKSQHGKTYATAEEELRRKSIFIENVKEIEAHNFLHSKGMASYSLEVNHFADLEFQEFRTMMNGLKVASGSPATPASDDRHTYLSPAMPVSVPDTVDWRKHGYVTPIKDQRQCGSCWAFSTTGSLEGQHFRKSGKLVSLSEQNLVDCAGGKYHNNGCDGGVMDYAFQYIKDNGGIDTEASYPYEGQDDQCHYKAKNIGATVTGFVDIPKGNEEKLKEAVATVGPVSIAIDAGHRSFQFYKTGVYVEADCSSTQLDHGVLIVGYGTEDGQDYWLVKNSWNVAWGDKGYIKMARNKNNQCGVASMASYPLV